MNKFGKPIVPGHMLVAGDRFFIGKKSFVHRFFIGKKSQWPQSTTKLSTSLCVAISCSTCLMFFQKTCFHRFRFPNKTQTFNKLFFLLFFCNFISCFLLSVPKVPPDLFSLVLFFPNFPQAQFVAFSLSTFFGRP